MPASARVLTAPVSCQAFVFGTVKVFISYNINWSAGQFRPWQVASVRIGRYWTGWCGTWADMIQAEYDRQGTTNRIGNLTPGMIKSGEDFPKLSTKAAETLHLIPVLAEVCRTLSKGSDADEHRQRAIDNLAKFYRILRSASMFLTDGEYNDAKSAIEWHLLHYNWLHHDAVNRGVRLYVIQYKHHNLWHIADHAKYLNPMFIWCYPFEDFVGRTRKGKRSSTKIVVLQRDTQLSGYNRRMCIEISVLENVLKMISH